MSLAIYAAPFNEDDNNLHKNIKQNSTVNTHNKTQKRPMRENFDTEKVNSVLQKIHNSSEEDDEEEAHLGDFNPPPKPQSSGVQKTISTENMQNKNSENMIKNMGMQPHPLYSAKNDLELNQYNTNYSNQPFMQEHFQKMGSVPSYVNMPITNQGNDALLEKLNYMIHLLEEKQDEKTNNVTEEVVLYSFLGIFIIFVIDSFARVGKYVR